MASKSSIDCYKKRLDISTSNHDQLGIANDNDLVGDAYFCSGKYEMAIQYYENSFKFYTEIGHSLGRIKSSYKLGTTHYKLAQYLTAIEYGKKCLEISTNIDEKSEIANSNRLLGNAYRRIGEYQKAVDCYEAGLEISTAIGNQSGIASNNSNLGNVYLSLGEYRKSIKCYEKGLEISVANNDQSGIAIKYGNLGNAYRNLGEYRKAIKYYEKGLEISNVIGDQLGIANKNSNLGNAYLCLTEYQKAIKYYQKGLEISIAIGDQSGIASNNGNLGNAYCNLGEYQKAIQYCEKGLEISSAIGDQSGIASNYGNLGNAYLSLGEYRKAIKYYEKGLEISSAIGDQSGIASNNGNLGNAYLSLREYQKAIQYYEKGLEISSAIGDQSGIANNNGNLGTAYLSLGEYRKAIKYYEKGLEISSAIGDQSGIARSNSNLGNAYLSLGEYQKAIKYCEKGLAISTVIGDQSGKASVKAYLGNVYLYSGEYKSASAHFEEAIRLFDEIFLNFVPHPNRLSFTTKYFEYHRLLMSCFVSLERAKSALLAIDLGKAKELHFSIEENRNWVGKEMNDYSRTTWNRISACEEETEIEEIQQIIQMAKNDTSILVFAFDNKEFLHTWVLNENFAFKKADAALETFPLLMLEEILEVENNLVHRGPVLTNRDSCRYNRRNSSQEFLKKLFQLLIDPVKNSLKGNKLIVVPDQQLFFVPFSCLIDENGDFLTSKYSIQITPSLHTLKASMQRANDSNIGFALFIGNPTVPNLNEAKPLPGAAKEVIYLAHLFHAKPLLGSAARKEVLLQHLTEASIIHIAACTTERGEILLTSRFPALSPYLLTQQDITLTPVKARLVVLSCCYTGRGEVSLEGVMCTTRSFLAAGARSVLATPWSISDTATTEFMERFYFELLKETPVCEALRRAQKFFQEHPEEYYQSVNMWAAFTIYGEDVKFEKQEIEEIREKSRGFFDGFVVLP